MRNRIVALIGVGLLVLSVPALAAVSKVSEIGAAPNPVTGGGAFCEGRLLIDQPPNQSNGIFNDADCALCGTGQQSIADNFVLASDATIGEIVMWTGYFPGNVPVVDDWTVIFHSDAAGVPGAAISTETAVPSVRVDTGLDLFGVDEYQVNMTLASPVALTAGTYWVEIFNNTAGSADQTFWEVGNLDATNGIADGVFATATPGVTWTALGPPATDLALQMCEAEPQVSVLEVPTLGTAGLIQLLLALAFVGVLVIRLR